MLYVFPGTTEYQTTTEVATEESTTEGNKTSWSKIIGNNTECIESTDESGSVVEERIDKDVFESTTETTTVEYTTAGGATTDFEPEGGKTEQGDAGATVMPYKKIPDDLEVILNMTKSINKKDEDYEYDYGEPTLPPSLPNLRWGVFRVEAIFFGFDDAVLCFLQDHSFRGGRCGRVREKWRHVPSIAPGEDPFAVFPPCRNPGGLRPEGPLRDGEYLR